jgi:hypothetical protein
LVVNVGNYASLGYIALVTASGGGTAGIMALAFPISAGEVIYMSPNSTLAMLQLILEDIPPEPIPRGIAAEPS